MKVRELIELLEQMDDDADIFLMTSSAWPIENTIAGVCERGDFTECEVPQAGEPERRFGNHRRTDAETRLPANDVFIVEGAQTRYGNKAAWEAASR